MTNSAYQRSYFQQRYATDPEFRSRCRRSIRRCWITCNGCSSPRPWVTEAESTDAPDDPLRSSPLLRHALGRRVGRQGYPWVAASSHTAIVGAGKAGSAKAPMATAT